MAPTIPHRIGFDIGGTFTDFVLHHGETGDISLYKRLTTPEDPSIGAIDGLKGLVGQVGLSLAEVADIVHGTTLVTNAIIERKGAKTGLLTTKGFRDVLEAGREQRYDVHDLFIKYPDPLVERRYRLEVDERMSRDGDVIRPLDLDQVARSVDDLVAQGVEAIAVCFLHSYANAAHERAVGEFIAKRHPGIFVSLSSDVVAELGEYERTCTTCANAFVQPLMDRYLALLERRLADEGFSGRLSLMLSSGGLTGPETARRLPIRLLESGPAGGGLATAMVGRAAGLPDLISFDMGGTTAKATLLENYKAEIAPQLEAGRIERFKKGSGLPIKAPVIDMIEIGAGGGSIASIDELGLMKVGPRSAGASPGPACYGLGGTDATVTDANLHLGYLDPNNFLGGRMALDPAKSRTALETVGAQIGLDAEQTAWGIYQIVCENMASAAGVHIVEKGHDPRRYSMVAIGGAGPAHAARVARLMGLKEVLIPQASGAASALGFLSAPASFEAVRTAVSVLDEKLNLDALNHMLAELEEDAKRHVMASGVAGEEIPFERSADTRLRGQFHEISVTVPAGQLTPGSIEDLKASFATTYERLYHKYLPGKIEVINWRVRAAGPAPAIELREPKTGGRASTALKGKRPAYFGDGYVEVSVYDRYALRPGDRIQGPAIIEERESTTIVPPSDTLEVDAALNLKITLGEVAAVADLAPEGASLEETIRLMEADPVTLEIFWSRMVNITEQCWTTVCRTAFSLIIGVAQDFSVEILDRNGETVASNPRGQPSFDLCMPIALRALLKRFPREALAPGDVLITNDPWLVAGHLDDVAVMIPIFKGGEVVGFVGVMGHVTDIGGNKRGGAAELFEEGLQIPPLKLYKAGQLNEDLFHVISSNVRETEQVIGDIMALVGSGEIGARAVSDLLDEYGLRNLDAFSAIAQRRSEDAMRKAIEAVPNGRFSSEISVDIGGQLTRLPVTIEVLDDSIVVDLEGTPPQMEKGGYNSSYNYTAARAKNPLKCLLTPHVRANEGCYRPIEVRVPKGSLLDCERPYAVRDRVVSGWNVTPLVLSAMAEPLPTRAQAFSGYPSSMTFYGRDENGTFSDYLMCGGGQGASAEADGKSGLLFPTSSANTSVELTEVRVPVVVEEKCFVADSGGAGKQRGGLAQRIRVRKLVDDGFPLTVGVLPAGVDLEIPSMFGGKPGAPISVVSSSTPAAAANAGRSAWVLQAPEDHVEVVLAGGHGFGDPALRSRADIERDIENGCVTDEAAKAEYGYDAAAKSEPAVAA